MLGGLEQRETVLPGGRRGSAPQADASSTAQGWPRAAAPRRVERRRHEALGQRRLAVGQRARLVEDHRAAAIDLLEHGRVADDDAAPGGQRDRADDRHRDGDEQRTGRRHDEHRQEPDRIAAPQPRGHGDRHGERRVDGAELVAEPAKPRAALLGVPHHLHDPRVAGVDRPSHRADRQRLLAVDRAGQHVRARRLGHHERLAGQVGLVHRAVALHDGPVDRADLVRKDDQVIADGDRVERHVLDRPAGAAMRDRGHPARQRLQHGRGAPDGERFQRLPAGQHQDDEGAGQVLAQQRGGDDRDPGEQIGSEASAGQPGGELHDEHAAAGRQADVEREIERRLRRSRPEAKADIRRDRRKRQGCDRQVTRQVRTWSSCRSATAACVNGWRVPGCFPST